MRFLDKHARHEKELRRLEREADRLHRAKWLAPAVPLERPYRRGWTKTFVLADGIDRRPDAAIFRTILAAVNQVVYSRERSFVHPPTRQPIVLRPRVLHVRVVEKYGWPASHRRFFELGPWRIDDAPFWLPCKRGAALRYKLIQTWWLREHIQPYLITHQRVNLPDVESRLAEIESYMTRTSGRERLSRLHGRSRWWRYLSKTRSEHQARTALIDQLRELNPD